MGTGCIFSRNKNINLIEMLREIVFHENASFSKWTTMVEDHPSEPRATGKV